MNLNNPLIVQSDSTLLLEVDNPLYGEVRDTINLFSHLEKSPEHIHTYSITSLSLWNAAALGYNADYVSKSLEKYSKYPIPPSLIINIRDIMERFGKLKLIKRGDTLLLQSDDINLLNQLSQHAKLSPFLSNKKENGIEISPAHRGHLKMMLIAVGYPVHDLAGYVDGDNYEIEMREKTTSGEKFSIREYQKMSAESFIGSKEIPGGSGVVVLPCGAGKTIVGIYTMSLLKKKTLILVTNITAARQWTREILDKTTLTEYDIGEYSGEEKVIKPVTIATYQILTYRRKKSEKFLHFDIFNKENWGLIIYDEVHLLPAPVFKFTADIQARRRLGLTATLIREDGLEKDVFSLIGPKKFDMPWRVLEKQGWIATAKCLEIRVELDPAQRASYISLSPREQVRVAYENSAKIDVVKDIIKRHKGEKILILAMYISQIKQYSKELSVPAITGSTPNDERDILLNKFRNDEIDILILSKVGNFAIDLPEAAVAIQISGTFGSRQEEAQRLGRILRPKKNGSQAHFYSVVTRESRELDFSMKRQLFLAEQGYPYEIEYF